MMAKYVKVVVGAVVVAVGIGYMAYLGALSSWRYYVTVDECMAADHLVGKRLRVSGHVLAGSLSISADRRAASFRLCGQNGDLAVSSSGVLPDNLAEDMDVVVEGTLYTDGQIHADRVITRCASKYAPKSAGDSQSQVLAPRVAP